MAKTKKHANCAAERTAQTVRAIPKHVLHGKYDEKAEKFDEKAEKRRESDGNWISLAQKA